MSDFVGGYFMNKQWKFTIKLALCLGLVIWFVGIALFKLPFGSISSMSLQDKYSDKIDDLTCSKKGCFCVRGGFFSKTCC